METTQSTGQWPPRHDDPWPTHPGTAPPTRPGAWGPPPASPSSPPTPPTPPSPPRSGGRGGQGRRSAAAVFAAAVLVGGVGYGVGRWSDDGGGSALEAAVTTTSPRPVSTTPPSLTGREAEPAAAVAKVLSPAVVQIETSQGLGSGFVYDKSGLIMTASHVTDGSRTVTVRFADGTQQQGTVVGEDPSTDVAVVRVPDTKGLKVADLGLGSQIEVGQTAVAIGSPFGLDQTVTAGIVSAVGRSTQTPGGVVPAIQTDAPINPGNSGGALANRYGQVIGINDSIATASGSSSGESGNVGVGFAIPIDVAKPVADDLVAGRTPEAGFLGVEPGDSTSDTAGAVIQSVNDGSPAEEAGIEPGDIVTAVNGSKVESGLDLAASIRTHKPGETVTLTVVRDGETRTVTAKLVAAPAN